MKGTLVSGETNPDAERMYEERRKGKLRCLFCENTVWLSRRIKELTTCSKHDALDPRHTGPSKRGLSAKNAGLFDGPPVPDGAMRVRRMREGAGVSRRRLAKMVMVSVSTIERYECGRTVVRQEAYRAIKRVCEEWQKQREVRDEVSGARGNGR